MFRILLFGWLFSQYFAYAGTLEFTESERLHVNTAAHLASLPPALQQRVANNTLSWMTQVSAQVLSCWGQFGGEAGVIAEPKPASAQLQETRATCAASLRALSAETGPAPRTADMTPAIADFLFASRAVVESAMRALEAGIDEADRSRAVADFNAYYRTLESGRLPLWMLRASAEPDEDPRIVRRA